MSADNTTAIKITTNTTANATVVTNLITRNLLFSGGMDIGQVELFGQIFPNGAEISSESIQIAMDAGLDVGWMIAREPEMFKGHKEAMLPFPELACEFAIMVAREGCDDTRAAACQDPLYAVKYARYVDGCARKDTRAAACKDPWYADMYAFYVDGNGRF